VSGEAVAGSIIGYLRLDADQFMAAIEKANLAADKLDTKTVDVKVKADTGVAEAKLAGVAAAEEKVDKSNAKVAKSGQDAGRGMGALATAIITLGPALVPIAAGTVGLAAGFGAMGAAGIFAVVGIVQEMKKGTALGASFTTMLGTLKGDLTTLGHTAAAGVLGPLQASVADLQTRMPALNGIIGEFSVITGKTAGVLTTGLIAGFIAFEPLARDAGVYILGLSQRFAAMMSGPGVVSFGDYVRSVFPQVMSDFESIVGAALRLIAALAPLGMGTLSILRTFSDLINALPVDVLATLATTAASVYIGFSAFKMLSVDMQGFGKALQKVGLSAETAAAGVRTLNIAAGVIGAIITVATLLYTAHAESVRKDQDAVNSLTDALIRGHGVIEADTVAERANALAKDGTLQAAKLLGMNLGDVTAASLGNAAATAKVNAALDAYNGKTQHGVNSAKSVALANNELGDAVDKVRGATENGVKTLDLAKQAYDAYNAAVAKAAAGGDAQAIAQQKVASTAGTTAAALATATTAQQATRDAAAAAAAKMYVENDAVGILKTSLDLLNGKAINAAQAQNSFDSSLVNMGDHVNATGKKIIFTTTSIGEMSSASASLRGQLNSQVTNLQGVIEANGGLANSTGKARAQMVTMRQQIIDNAVAHGVDRAAVTAYIDKLLKIPKKIPPTKLDANTAAAVAKIAAYQRMLNALPAYKTITIGVKTAGSLASTYASQVPKGHADGGPVSGSGDGDTQPAMLTPGEFIVRRDGSNIVDAMRYFGAQGFASGGAVSKTPRPTWTVNGKEYGSAISAHNAGIAASVRQAAAIAAAAKALATTQREYQYTYLPSFIKALGGTTSALTTAGTSLIAHVASSAAAHQMSSSMVAKLSSENKSLDKLASSRDSIATQIKSANDALTAAQKLFADQQSSVTSSLGAVDLTKATSPAELIAQLTGQIKSAKDFGSQIGTLKGEGLNADMLKQLADAGPAGEGSPLAQMMGATPSQIDQINALMAQLQTTAASTGTSIATSLYGSGVSAAQGLVAGLESQQKAIEAQMMKIALVMQSAIKKALGIKSPSTVMRGLGQFTGQGFALGIADTHAGTRRAALGMAAAAVPRIHMPAGSMDSASKAARASAVAGSGASGDGMLSVTVPVMVNDRVLFEVVRTVSIQEAKNSITHTSGLK